MKIKSRILGMSYMGTHYSVVIEDYTDVSVKLPIIVSEQSAIDVSSSINIKQTGKGGNFLHKLMNNINHDIKEIFIYDLIEGKFKSKAIKLDGSVIEFSVSNALRIAATTGCDLYVDEEVFKTAGMVIDESGEIDKSADISYSDNDGEEILDSIGELKKQMEIALSEENYEEAAKLRDIINKIEGKY